MHTQWSEVDDSTLLAGRLNRRSFLKLGLGVAGTASVTSILAACASQDDEEAPAADSDDGGDDIAADSDDHDDGDVDEVAKPDDDFDVEQLIDDWLEEFEPFEAPELDLERLEVEIQGETYDVWAYENTWVGEVTDDLFIAFSIQEGSSEGSGEVSAYACDSGDASVYLTGELVDGEADLDDCVDKIQLSLVDGEVTGTITLEGEEPLSFVAVPSDGDAGLYRAETIEMGEIEITTRWVVLDDGRQRGGRKCRNPWTGDCMYCPVPR
jgi:hypothetical protein